MIWWIVPAAIGFFGLVVTLTGLARLGKRKVMTGGFRLLGGALVLSAAGLMTLVGINLHSYSRLTNERHVATVELTYMSAQSYRADVTLSGEDTATSYDVRGDEVLFEARIIKWTPWANIIGYDAIYKLDRMSGRYTSIDDELSNERTLYALQNDPGVSAFDLINDSGEWQNTVDAYYGSGTFVPMADGARYEIRITQSGLIADALNLEAERARQGWVPPATKPIDRPISTDEAE